MTVNEEAMIELNKLSQTYQSPTPQLRFVIRRNPAGDLQRILQQKWFIVCLAKGSSERKEEWRDVPMAEEVSHARTT